MIDALIAVVVVSIGLVGILDALTSAQALFHFETQNMKAGMALSGIMERIDAATAAPSTVGTWTAVKTVFAAADYNNIDYKVTVPSPDIPIGSTGLMDALSISAYAASYEVVVRFKTIRGTYSERKMSSVWGKRP